MLVPSWAFQSAFQSKVFSKVFKPYQCSLQPLLSAEEDGEEEERAERFSTISNEDSTNSWSSVYTKTLRKRF